MTFCIDLSPAIKSSWHPLDEVCINTIRTLAIDAFVDSNFSGAERHRRRLAKVARLDR
jgi:hypothetical protein